jgi:hypothetical protein
MTGTVLVINKISLLKKVNVINTRNINKIIILIVVNLLYSLSLFADAPYEKYHVAYNDISKDVLKSTIGILNINSIVKKVMKLKTYSRDGKRFIYNKTLKVKKTTPISNYGSHPPVDKWRISNYRYPILAKIEQYLCIVYDPIKNLKTWVNIKEIEENFYTSIMMSDSMKTPDSFFVDIFCFTNSRKRKIYKEPRNDADFIILTKYKFKYLLLKIIEQRNGFIKVGSFHLDHNTDKITIEPLGWVRIRNDQDMLMIWINDVDLY